MAPPRRNHRDRAALPRNRPQNPPQNRAPLLGPSRLRPAGGSQEPRAWRGPAAASAPACRRPAARLKQSLNPSRSTPSVASPPSLIPECSVKHAAGETPALSRVRTGSGSAGRCGVVAALCLFPSEIPQILLSVVCAAQAGKFLKGSEAFIPSGYIHTRKKGSYKKLPGASCGLGIACLGGVAFKTGSPTGVFPHRGSVYEKCQVLTITF